MYRFNIVYNFDINWIYFFYLIDKSGALKLYSEWSMCPDSVDDGW
jgi:hypothetical protein